jgi:F-type H+-transporting ATPase subunit b
MFDATFWVAVSFVIFFGLLIYFKVPQNVNNLLTKMIVDIKNEIDESEKLRSEAKKLLDDAQNKLNTAEQETKKITEQAKSDSEKLIADMNEKFNKSAEIKKNLAQTKISQMKDAAIKNIKDTSIKIAVETVKKTISNSHP